MRPRHLQAVVKSYFGWPEMSLLHGQHGCLCSRKRALGSKDLEKCIRARVQGKKHWRRRLIKFQKPKTPRVSLIVSATRGTGEDPWTPCCGYGWWVRVLTLCAGMGTDVGYGCWVVEGRLVTGVRLRVRVLDTNFGDGYIAGNGSWERLLLLVFGTGIGVVGTGGARVLRLVPRAGVGRGCWVQMLGTCHVPFHVPSRTVSSCEDGSWYCAKIER